MMGISKIVTSEQLQTIISTYRPPGLFLCREGKRWIAVDNTTGEACTEEFLWKWQALCWLRDH